MTTPAPDATTGPSVSRRRRWITRGLAAVTSVAVLGAGVVAGVVSRSDDGAGTPELASNEKVQAAIASGQLLFVGASYTVGLGATGPRFGYAPVLATSLDRRFVVAAVSGTGFMNPGSQHQGTFGERIERLPSTLDPRIVVIQGGRNDAGYPLSEVQTAAQSTIELARHRFTHAQVVVMGPIPGALPVSPRLLGLRDRIEAAARSAGAGFVDPLAQGWITRSNVRRYAGPVPFHPNDAGYRYIAGRLLADLPAALEQADKPLDAAPTPGTTRSPLPQPSATAGEEPARGA